MNLKKSDKIIAVIGVIVLIAAAISVVVLLPTDEGNGNGDETTDEDLTEYDVTYEIENNTMNHKNLIFSRKILKPEVTINDEEFLSLPIDNLKSITFNISYTDQKVGGLLNLLFKGFIGKDQVSITITDPDEDDHSVNIKGSGQKLIEIDNINSVIDTSTIRAKNDIEAQRELESRYESKWKDQMFTLHANYKMGEIIRPLLRLREILDKDRVHLSIEYEYFEYELVPLIPNEDNEDGTLGETQFNGIETYASMGLPGKH